MGGEPVSGSPYIIICNGRIGVAAGESIQKKIVAVSNAAAQLVAFMQAYYAEFEVSDLHNISTIQHQLMDFLLGESQMNPAQVREKIEALIAAMYALEDKY